MKIKRLHCFEETQLCEQMSFGNIFLFEAVLNVVYDEDIIHFFVENFPIQKSSRSWLSMDKENSTAYFLVILF